MREGRGQEKEKGKKQRKGYLLGCRFLLDHVACVHAYIRCCRP